MRILISGASGFIGQKIISALSAQNHQLISLHRGTGTHSPHWDIDRKMIEIGDETDIDVVIHLAGENIAAGRWSAKKKDAILTSRVAGTKLICDHFSREQQKPKVIISASAIGYYGSRGDELLDEESAKGSGFLADVCQQWEDATQVAVDAGIRVVNIRLGMVLSSTGGALAKMLPPFKLGLGGIIGSGDQYINWITLNDVIGAIDHIIKTETVYGPVNLVSPEPVTNRHFTKTLGAVLRRPTIFPLPAFVAQAIFGEMADELLLGSTKIKPTKLIQAGYSFADTTLADALKSLV